MGFGTDEQLLVDILKYKQKFDYNIIIETGTYHGTSSRILSSVFDKVYTCEINQAYKEDIDKKINGIDNIEVMFGSSPDCLKKWFQEIGHDKFFLFLDAHWMEDWPIQDELQQVIDFGYKPFIFIHDFYCGHEGWKYDSYGNIRLDYDYVKEKMDKIYGVDNYIFEVSQLSKNGLPNLLNDLRGCGFFYPKI